MKKRIWAVLISCVMLIGLLCLAGCEKKYSSADEAVKAYVEANEKRNSEVIVKLIHPDYYDFMANHQRGEAVNYSDEKKFDLICKQSYSMFQQDKYIYDEEIKNSIRLDYEITDRYDATEEEIAEFFEFNSKKFGFDDTIEAMTLVRFDIIMKKSDGEEYYTTSQMGVCFKIDGNWYMMDDDFSHLDLWSTGRSRDENGAMVYEECVQWIVDWRDK